MKRSLLLAALTVSLLGCIGPEVIPCHVKAHDEYPMGTTTTYYRNSDGSKCGEYYQYRDSWSAYRPDEYPAEFETERAAKKWVEETCQP